MAVFFTLSPSAGSLVGCATIKSAEVVTLPLPRRAGRAPAPRGATLHRVARYDFGNPLFHGPRRLHSATVLVTFEDQGNDGCPGS